MAILAMSRRAILALPWLGNLGGNLEIWGHHTDFPCQPGAVG